MQTTKLNMKLYDQVAEEKIVEETRDPQCGVMGIFFFAIIFLATCLCTTVSHSQFRT